MKSTNPFSPDSDPDFVSSDDTDVAIQRSGRDPLWLLTIIPIAVGIFTLGAWSQNHSPQPPPSGPYEYSKAAQPSKLMVQVAGAVRHPGLYELPFDARVNDAVRRAEPLPDADVNALNLAAWAEDGTRIDVPLKSTGRPESQNAPLQPAPASIQQPTTPIRPAKSSERTAPAVPTTKAAPTRIININRATLSDLMELPGVGPVMGQAILDYRKAKGPFESVDELDDVKGIGPKKLEKLRPWVTVR